MEHRTTCRQPATVRILNIRPDFRIVKLNLAVFLSVGCPVQCRCRHDRRNELKASSLEAPAFINPNIWNGLSEQWVCEEKSVKLALWSFFFRALECNLLGWVVASVYTIGLRSCPYRLLIHISSPALWKCKFRLLHPGSRMRTFDSLETQIFVTIQFSG